MTFEVFADGSANLTQSMREGITLLPCTYTVDGEERVYDGNLEGFDAHAYYEGLRGGRRIQTSLLNTELFLSRFLPVLQKGLDVIYVSMSSGISGTCSAAMAAARQLMEKLPERYIHVVDSCGCGFGSGLLAAKAAELCRRGVKAREAAEELDAEVPHICQYFTVDDMNHLRRTGRISGVAAKIGTVLNIKPLLYGDEDGHIVTAGVLRGRRKAIEAMLKKYAEKRMTTGSQHVCISHGDCAEDAEALAAGVRAITPEVPITIAVHEPFSGAHVGPGMLGLFFRGKER